MKKVNFYWPVYKNLEKEVIKLADEIHFCDEQLDVYSVKIADTLFRVSTEIESLIKDLYREEKNEEPEKPGLALTALNKLWILDKKAVIVSASNMYFKEESNRVFSPFNYENHDENDYYGAYNAVKHDRLKNISKANIRALIRALASLYLLNLYYKDYGEEIKLKKGELGTRSDNSFDITRGSDIFSIKTAFVGVPSQKPQNGSERSIGSYYADSVYLQIIDNKTLEHEWKRIAENAKII